MPFRANVKRKFKAVFHSKAQQTVTEKKPPNPIDPSSSQGPSRPSDSVSSSDPTHKSPGTLVEGNDATSKAHGFLDTKQRPIRELWDQAYENLRVEEESLIRDYEDRLSRDLATRPDLAGGPEVSKRELMETILKYKMDEINRDTWKLKYGSNEVQVKDLVEPVLGVVDWANEYITGALEANPYASMAWAGISLLLPLLLNPSKQAASQAKGLDCISSLIVQGRMREDLYSRRYESIDDGNVAPESSISRSAYKNGLGMLYQQIIKFQATSYCYYARNDAFRLGLDVIKWNDWDSLLDDIKERERVFSNIVDVWRDTVYNDEFAAAESRHQEIMSHWRSVGTDVSGLRKAIEEAQMEEKRLGLLSWLCDVDPSENHNAALDRHEGGTSVWLVEDSEEFEVWKQAPGSLLWLHGNAGSGKTILSSSVIRHLWRKRASDPETALAYFYFSFSDSRKQNVLDMLASLLKQIVSQRPNIPLSFKDLGVYKERGERPDIGTLETVIIASVCGFSAVHLVVDAMDECPTINGERRKLLNSIRRIVEKAPDNLHMFCTSRNEADINTAISPLLTSSSRAAIDLTKHRDAVDHDILVLINATLSSDDYSSWPDDIKAEVRDAITKRADGMFQYVHYQLEALRELSSPAHIRTALQDLPIGLDATYDRVLKRINPKFQPQVLSALTWLAFSKEVLTLKQLAEVFNIRPGRTPAYDDAERLFQPQDVLKYLPGLVHVNEQPDVDLMRAESPSTFSFSDDSSSAVGSRYQYVRLIHFSVKEYLISSRIAQSAVASHFSLSEEYGHQYIAWSCVEWLLQYENECMAQDSEPPFYQGDGRYASDLGMHSYALRYWMLHLEAVPRESWSIDITHAAGHLLACRSWFVRYLISNFRNETYPLSFRLMAWLRPYLHTARLGLRQLTDWLTSVDPPVDEYMTQEDLDVTLQVASYGGNVTVIQSLLRSGANPDAEGVTIFGPALQAAAYGKNLAAVSHLLENGADINNASSKPGFRSALQAAAASHHLQIVQLLVDRGADITLSTKREKCVLASALSFEGGGTLSESFQCLEFLLKKLASQQGEIRETVALSHAVFEARWFSGVYDRFGVLVREEEETQDIINTLLASGINVNAPAGDYGYPLQAACVEASEASQFAVTVLLDAGADVNSLGGRYGTALQAACCKVSDTKNRDDLHRPTRSDRPRPGWAESVRRSSLSSRFSNSGRSANFKLKCVETLIDHGADVNARGGEYGTALQAACYYHADEIVLDDNIVKTLVRSGANINAQGGRFGTALQAGCAAGRWSNHDLVVFLLQKQADVNIKGGKYGTALQAACRKGSINIVRLLLDHGAEVNAKSGKYGTALHAAASCDRRGTDILQLLLDNGAEVNENCGKFGTALQAACHSGLVENVRFLLDHGAEVNTTGGLYGTALQSACFRQDFDIVQLLLERDADVHVQGGMFGSAWHAVTSRVFKPPYYGNPLSSLETIGSARRDAVHMVLELLLDHGVDVNDTRGPHGTALQATAFWQVRSYQTSLIAIRTQFLIIHGANVNINAGKYGFPLQSACVFDDDDPRATDDLETYRACAGNQALFLLKNCPDLDVNAQGGMYCTALQAAVYSGLEAVVKILVLEKNADVNIRGGEFGSAINAAVFRGFWNLFKILLKAGALPDSRRRVPQPDLDWLARMKEKHGRGAVERYWKVWEKFKDEEN
ncbi:ankyrin repeat-containing domain protein [Cercophora scortea]|uniref:Ankyrin repeat-containing domain protein n=1 Tax=Cercophora scortea TaxID=314031 RepID=A0AAE0I354_9PEZI|nr:ankyrin repeat-containing domain protein [Cercophora scortea]